MCFVGLCGSRAPGYVQILPVCVWTCCSCRLWLSTEIPLSLCSFSPSGDGVWFWMAVQLLAPCLFCLQLFHLKENETMSSNWVSGTGNIFNLWRAAKGIQTLSIISHEPHYGSYATVKHVSHSKFNSFCPYVCCFQAILWPNMLRKAADEIIKYESVDNLGWGAGRRRGITSPHLVITSVPLLNEFDPRGDDPVNQLKWQAGCDRVLLHV